MSHRQDLLDPFDSPMDVEVVSGEVVALGPEGLAMALTPEAAKISGFRLIAAADQALKLAEDLKDQS